MSSMFERLNLWLRSNGNGVALTVAGLFLVVAIGCGGLRLERWITADVPLEIQKAFAVPSRVPLMDSKRIFSAWMKAGEQFAENIEYGYEFLGTIEGLFTLAFVAGGSAIPGFGGLALTFMGGLLIKGPGTGREKNKSYNKGREEAESVLLPLLREAGITVPVVDKG